MGGCCTRDDSEIIEESVHEIGEWRYAHRDGGPQAEPWFAIEVRGAVIEFAPSRPALRPVYAEARRRLGSAAGQSRAIRVTAQGAGRVLTGRRLWTRTGGGDWLLVLDD